MFAASVTIKARESMYLLVQFSFKGMNVKKRQLYKLFKHIFSLQVLDNMYILLNCMKLHNLHTEG